MKRLMATAQISPKPFCCMMMPKPKPRNTYPVITGIVSKSAIFVVFLSILLSLNFMFSFCRPAGIRLGYRWLPRKNNARVPGPEWEPMTAPT